LQGNECVCGEGELRQPQMSSWFRHNPLTKLVVQTLVHCALWRATLHVCRDSYFHALAHLMRLRQACCHRALVRSGARQREASAAELQAARTLAEARKLELLEVLTGASQNSGCAACGDIPDDPVAAFCGHVLCRCAVPHSLHPLVADFTIMSHVHHSACTGVGQSARAKIWHAGHRQVCMTAQQIANRDMSIERSAERSAKRNWKVNREKI
jgi:hypothetical protein